MGRELNNKALKFVVSKKIIANRVFIQKLPKDMAVQWVLTESSSNDLCYEMGLLKLRSILPGVSLQNHSWGVDV